MLYNYYVCYIYSINSVYNDRYIIFEIHYFGKVN